MYSPEQEVIIKEKIKDLKPLLFDSGIKSRVEFLVERKRLKSLINSGQRPDDIDNRSRLAEADKEIYLAALEALSQERSKDLPVEDYFERSKELLIEFRTNIENIEDLDGVVNTSIVGAKDNADELAAIRIAARQRRREIEATLTKDDWALGLWSSFKELGRVEKSGQDDFFTDKVEDLIARGWKTLESNPEILKNLFLAALAASELIEELNENINKVTPEELKKLEDRMNTLEQASNPSDTAVAESANIFTQVKHHFDNLKKRWQGNINDDFRERAKNKGLNLEAELDSYSKFYESLVILDRNLISFGGSRKSRIMGESLTKRKKEIINKLWESIEDNERFLTEDRIPQEDRNRLVSLYERLEHEMEILNGTATDEKDEVFSKRVKDWMEQWHVTPYGDTKFFWEMYQAGNLIALKDNVGEMTAHMNYFEEQKKILHQLDGDADNEDFEHRQRKNALEIQLNRLQEIIAAVGTAAETSVKTTEYDVDEFGEYGKEIITAPVGEVLAHIVTNDYDPGEVQKWRKATEKRIEILKEQGQPEIANFLDQALQMWLFGVWVKGKSIDIDRLSNFPNQSLGDTDGKGFAEANGRDAYLKLRNTPLFVETIQPILDRMDKYLDGYGHPELEDDSYGGPSFASSSGDWDFGRQLPMLCHKDLYDGIPSVGDRNPFNADYKTAIDALVADVPDSQKDEKREEFVLFLSLISLYEASSEDKRGTASNKKLGIDRSAVKHRKASIFVWDGAPPPQSWLASRSYKLKNNAEDAINNGCYLWHVLPEDMLKDKVTDEDLKPDNQADLRKKLREAKPLTKHEQFIIHAMRYKVKQEILGMWVHHQFGQHEAWHQIEDIRWTPDNVSSGVPSVEDFHKWQILDASGKARFPDLSANNYTQTMTAMGKMYEKASTCWENDISGELEAMNINDFGNKIAAEIGSFGTNLAMALSFTIPLSSVKARGDDPPEVRAEIIRMNDAAKHMWKALQATVTMYAVYLLSQINIVNGATAIAKSMNNREYNMRYDVALEKIKAYLMVNTSMNNGYDELDDGSIAWKDSKNKMNDWVVADISTGEFKKKASLKPGADTVNFNQMLQFFRDGKLTSLTIDELRAHHQFPYKQPGDGDTSVHDD